MRKQTKKAAPKKAKPRDMLAIRFAAYMKRSKMSHAEVAVKLGYRHSNSINMWITRAAIPHYQRAQVEKLLIAKR